MRVMGDECDQNTSYVISCMTLSKNKYFLKFWFVFPILWGYIVSTPESLNETMQRTTISPYPCVTNPKGT